MQPLVERLARVRADRRRTGSATPAGASLRPPRACSPGACRRTGTSSVTTLSSSSTIAPQPVHRVCVDRPCDAAHVALHELAGVLVEVAFLDLAVRVSSIFVVVPAVRALQRPRPRVELDLRPALSAREHFPVGGAFVSVGSLSTGGGVGRRESAADASDIGAGGRSDRRSEISERHEDTKSARSVSSC